MSTQEQVLEAPPEEIVEGTGPTGRLTGTLQGFSLNAAIDSNGNVILSQHPGSDLPKGVVPGFDSLQLPRGTFQIQFFLTTPDARFANPAIVFFPDLAPGMGEVNDRVGFGVPPQTLQTAVCTFYNDVPQITSQQYSIEFFIQAKGTELFRYDPTIVNTPDPG